MITETYYVSVHTDRLGALRHLLTIGQRKRHLEVSVFRTRSAVTTAHHSSVDTQRMFSYLVDFWINAVYKYYSLAAAAVSGEQLHIFHILQMHDEKLTKDSASAPRCPYNIKSSWHDGFCWKFVWLDLLFILNNFISVMKSAIIRLSELWDARTQVRFKENDTKHNYIHKLEML